MSSDYSLRQLVEMDACTSCSLCAQVCPAALAGRDVRLSGVYRLAAMKGIQRFGFWDRLLRRQPPSREELSRFGETVFRCTLCGNCQQVCPVGIRLRDLWLTLRSDLVSRKAYPEKVDGIGKNLLESRNVFAEDNEERAEWVENMRQAPDHGFVKDRAEVVYFTGCVASYFPMAQKIPMALAAILEAAEVDFTLLGRDEWCCGFPLLGAGLGQWSRQFVEHNVEAVRSKGAREVVFACPSCYQTWREHYPPMFALAHATEFLDRLVRDRRVCLKELPLTVTYHDPCDLGRGSHVYEAPRRIIRAIPGVRLVELDRNRENCPCCGGGGNLEMIDPELSSKIAGEKIDAVLRTGAQAVVTACQQCVRTMNTYVRRNKVPLEVLDVTELVRRALTSNKERP